jgi:hypothetical protein
MSQVTADLEYFKCDVCGTFFYRDIFCDHRRHCTGANSGELNKRQADVFAKRLDAADTQARAAKGGPNVTMATIEKRQETKVRSALAKEVYAEEHAALRAKLRKFDADALMAELNMDA